MVSDFRTAWTDGGNLVDIACAVHGQGRSALGEETTMNEQMTEAQCTVIGCLVTVIFCVFMAVLVPFCVLYDHPNLFRGVFGVCAILIIIGIIRSHKGRREDEKALARKAKRQ